MATSQLLRETHTVWPRQAFQRSVVFSPPPSVYRVRVSEAAPAALAAPGAAAAVGSALSFVARSPTRRGQLMRIRSVAVEGAQAEFGGDETTSSSFEAPLERGQSHDSEGRLLLKNLTRAELEKWCASIGESDPARRALHLWRWLYADDCWIHSLEDAFGIQGGLSRAFIDNTNAVASIDGGLLLQEVVRSDDGTRKLVFKLTHGQAAGGTIETVLIPVVRESGQRNRITLCVSSQVGCAMNCQFCFTGRMGLLGNLTTAQIVQQVVEARKFLAIENDKTPMTNLVFMGMGEPLHNMEAVLGAIDIIHCNLGLHISLNKITVSTVGLVDEMREFVSRSRVQLALSLHATTDEVRSWIVPVNRRHDMNSLMTSLRDLFPRGQERSVLIEYVMLRGINDTAEDARRLVELMDDIEGKVNLIVFNPHKGTRFLPSENEQILEFRSIIIQAGRVCTIRDSRGDDEMAACGQLGGDPGPQQFVRPPPIIPVPPQFEPMMASSL